MRNIRKVFLLTLPLPFGSPSYLLLRLRRRLDVVQSHEASSASSRNPPRGKRGSTRERDEGKCDEEGSRDGGKINWRFSTVDPQRERLTYCGTVERNQIFIDSLEGKMYRGEMIVRKRCFLGALVLVRRTRANTYRAINPSFASLEYL